MSAAHYTSSQAPKRAPDAPPPGRPGPLGRLGAWTAGHFGHVLIGWLLVVGVLGAFAPQVTSVLSGVGRQSNGSESVLVRELAQEHFGQNASSAIQVVVSSKGHKVTDASVRKVIAEVTRELSADCRIGEVVPPQPGAGVSRDGRTAVVLGGADANTDDMRTSRNPCRELSSFGTTLMDGIAVCRPSTGTAGATRASDRRGVRRGQGTPRQSRRGTGTLR